MRNRSLIFSLVASSLFIPSIEALESTNDFDSLENENNIGINILIAEGGGGGGMSPKAKAEKEAQRQKTKDAAKKRIIKARIAAGKSLTDKEKKFAANQVTNILKVLKNSKKNGNKAYAQTLLKELYYDYGLGEEDYDAMKVARQEDPNFAYSGKRIMEVMSDEQIEFLIKTYESGFKLSEAKSKREAGFPLTDEENNLLFNYAFISGPVYSYNPGLNKEFYEYFKNNNLNTLDKAVNEVKKLIQAMEDKDELLIAKIRANLLMRVGDMTEGDHLAGTFMEFVYSQNGANVKNLLPSENRDNPFTIQYFLRGLK